MICVISNLKYRLLCVKYVSPPFREERFCEEMLSVLGIWFYQYLDLQVAPFTYFISTSILDSAFQVYCSCIHLFPLLPWAFYMPGTWNLKMKKIKSLPARICNVEECGEGWGSIESYASVQREGTDHVLRGFEGGCIFIQGGKWRWLLEDIDI